MTTTILKPVAAISTAVLLAVSLVACSPGTSTPSETNGALPPVIVTPSELAGTTVEITQEQPLVISVEDATEVEAWVGSVVDINVATFVPGEDDGDAQFNPGFEAVSAGSTEASVTSPEGEVLEFTITVR